MRESTVRDDLTNLYERLRELIDEAESWLLSHHFSTPVSYCYKDDEQGTCYLGIQKLGGRWRLSWCSTDMPEEVHLDNPTTWEWRPLTDCSLRIRFEAANHLKGLRSALLESQEKFVKEVEAAINDYESVLHN
jgi:hypothetical protein